MSVHRVTSRETLRVKEVFTNGFAQTVYRLEDGTELFISYSQDEVEIVRTDPTPLEPHEVMSIVNSTEEDV